MSEPITVERHGSVLLVGLNRPEKRNAVSVAMFVDISRAWGELERDDGLRCGVLHAHGDHFTGGLDLAEWAAVFSSGRMPLADDGLDPLGVYGPPVTKPVVSAVQGICFTIGIELMLATDIRVAARDARFGQIEIKRGIYPVGGATIRMPREIGWANAMRWLLTGDEIPADEAYRIGLVQELVEPGQQLPRALDIAERIAAQAPLGVRATLASARLALADEAHAAARLLPDLAPIIASDDAREGVMSFLERRPAALHRPLSGPTPATRQPAPLKRPDPPRPPSGARSATPRGRGRLRLRCRDGRAAPAASRRPWSTPGPRCRASSSAGWG